MKRNITILLLSLTLTLKLSAQIVYDTIQPEVVFMGNLSWDESFIFKDFKTQAQNYFEKIDFKQLDCFGEKVSVETIFGKNGELRNTRIIKSAHPVCDSIAFYFVLSLKDWLPGMAHGNFVDIPFIFPISFDDETLKRSWTLDVFFKATEQQFNRRRECFDFIYSGNPELQIINDFNFFRYFIAEAMNETKHIHILDNYKLKRAESSVLEINQIESKNTHLLIWDPSKDWILYEYKLRRNKIRIPRKPNLFLIFFDEGQGPLIQTKVLDGLENSSIDLNLKTYTKEQLMDEIDQYKH